MAYFDILIIKYYLALHGVTAKVERLVILHAEHGAGICSGNSSDAAAGGPTHGLHRLGYLAAGRLFAKLYRGGLLPLYIVLVSDKYIQYERNGLHTGYKDYKGEQAVEAEVGIKRPTEHKIHIVAKQQPCKIDDRGNNDMRGRAPADKTDQELNECYENRATAAEEAKLPHWHTGYF